MKVTRENLVRKFSIMPTEELIERWIGNTNTELADDVLSDELRKRNVAIPERETSTTPPHEKDTLFIKKLYSGEASLGAAFWLIFFVGGWIANALSIALALKLMNINKTLSLLAFLAGPLGYACFALICVWRCSRDHKNRFLVWLARILALQYPVIFAVIVLVLVLGDLYS